MSEVGWACARGRRLAKPAARMRLRTFLAVAHSLSRPMASTPSTVHASSALYTEPSLSACAQGSPKAFSNLSAGTGMSAGLTSVALEAIL